MKKLTKILTHIDPIQVIGNKDILVSGIEFDSRNITENKLFVAIKGSISDGHRFINTAINNGANCIICENLPAETRENICYVLVKNSNHSLGILSSAFYEFPSRNIKLIGITGTNGKTTIATLLYNLFMRSGYKTGLISTIAIHIGNKIIETSHTTPDAIKINSTLKKMVDSGCEYCFMEVSSHAIDQDRIAGLEFTGGVFTNLTHDHLDYHKTFKEYLIAKKKFFDNLPKNSFAVTNSDDKNGKVMLQNTKGLKLSYGLKTMADYSGKVLEVHTDGMLLKIKEKEVWTNFIGDFNASNLLAVYGVASELKMDNDEILRVISELHPVRGRFETITSNTGVMAIIDYAHTPDALKNVLTTINKIRKSSNIIITVVGAGGNRDKQKRPQMAAIVSELSDKIILTSDNPRNEDPSSIISEMEDGIETKNQHKYIKITDRREAIKTACMLAKSGDVILIAGKGHETYQDINGVKSHFDDKEEIEKQFSLLIKTN